MILNPRVIALLVALAVAGFHELIDWASGHRVHRAEHQIVRPNAKKTKSTAPLMQKEWKVVNSAYSDEDEREYRKRQEEFRQRDIALRFRLWILIAGMAVLFIAPFVAGIVEFIRKDWPNRPREKRLA